MTKKSPQYLAWLIDADIYLAIYDLAIKRGKKPGDNMQDEAMEVIQKNRDKCKLLGMTDNDIDLLTGNLREKGFKIYNPKEKKRAK
jgi:hypothetical protein